jgi:hypothetical protein
MDRFGLFWGFNKVSSKEGEEHFGLWSQNSEIE